MAPPPHLVEWLQSHNLDVEEYLPLTVKMGLHTVGPEAFHLMTMEDVDPFQESGATEEQRTNLDAALAKTEKRDFVPAPPEPEKKKKRKKKRSASGASKEELRRLSERLRASIAIRKRLL